MKDYCIDDHWCGVAILTPAHLVLVCHCDRSIHKSRIIAASQSAWGWMSRFGVKRSTRETGGRYWRRLTLRYLHSFLLLPQRGSQ